MCNKGKIKGGCNIEKNTILEDFTSSSIFFLPKFVKKYIFFKYLMSFLNSFNHKRLKSTDLAT